VRLINDILDTEKIASGKMELTLLEQNLVPIVQQAIETLHGYANEFNVQILLHAHENDLPVLVDHDRIVQVVVNLLSNAIKFSPAGGTVDVRIHREKNRARVSVVDRGAGVPEEFWDRIFQKFAQADATDARQKGGTGLGLNICKYIAEKHGGTIGFHSVVGSGTEFCFELPLSPRDAVGAMSEV
jgi:signal transduction histidine kinase